MFMLNMGQRQNLNKDQTYLKNNEKISTCAFKNLNKHHARKTQRKKPHEDTCRTSQIKDNGKNY